MKRDRKIWGLVPVVMLIVSLTDIAVRYVSREYLLPPTPPKEPEVRMAMPPPGHWSINTGECDSKQPAHVEVETPWGQKIHMYCSKEAK